MAQLDTIDTLPRSAAATAAQLERLDRIARVMDLAFRLPGTRIRIGLDSIIGLVPGVGDTLALLPAVYIIGSAWQMGMSARGLARMAANTALDTAVGSIPVLGDIFDAGFKSNARNVALLKEHLAQRT